MPSNNTPKIIFLKGCPMGKEGVAGAAGILPGMLVEDVGGTVTAHSTVGGVAVPAFARPNEVVGDGIDTAYADGDTVLYGVAYSGMEVYSYISDGENIAAGDYLESGGNGQFVTVAAGLALVKALETVNNTAGGAPARMKVEVI